MLHIATEYRNAEVVLELLTKEASTCTISKVIYETKYIKAIARKINVVANLVIGN